MHLHFTYPKAIWTLSIEIHNRLNIFPWVFMHACICPSISDKWNYSKCLRMNWQTNISVRCHPGKVGISHKHTRNIYIAKWRHGITPRAESELPTPKGGSMVSTDPGKRNLHRSAPSFSDCLIITCCMVHSGRKGKKKKKLHFFLIVKYQLLARWRVSLWSIDSVKGKEKRRGN